MAREHRGGDPFGTDPHRLKNQHHADAQHVPPAEQTFLRFHDPERHQLADVVWGGPDALSHLSLSEGVALVVTDRGHCTSSVEPSVVWARAIT